MSSPVQNALRQGARTPPHEGSPPDVSIVVPVYDEEEAAPALAREIAAAFSGTAFEILFVDDASRDGTLEQLRSLASEIPQLRVLTHRRNAGQSRAIRTGVLAARAQIVVTLDGDGQNDPADAPGLASALARAPANIGLIGGERTKPPGHRGQAMGVKDRQQRPAAPPERPGDRHGLWIESNAA